ncbi:OprD family porin [Pseudomonas sp. 5P_5.1_Bac1]|uniref:OprD family porin n=1 Tax=Pseudomonas sp. 5P_5.1_Bac1 TaxID=2971616 RepID=UPI0021C94A80|nr:OprD family porin [Pseudomonas sp. 5P_5.1_Bac1]MCU1724883.1 OprD family porin [Pseudomonas sp. 5P_5.1_Bac1]
MLRTLTPLALAILCSNAHAAFLDDSKASVEARNFYFNRDFRQDGAAQSKAEEWAQGFILRYESGFTEGTLGFGVDAIGLLGLKLDSSPDRAGSGLLQRDREAPKRAQDSSSDLGLTAKVRASNSVLKLGTLIPKLPVLMPNDSRLLPQVFQGGQVTVQEISNLSVDLGRLRQVNQRDSQDYEDMSVTTGAAKNIVVRQTTTDRFDFGHALYKWNDSLSTSYSYGGLENLYRQHMLGLTHTWALGDGQTLKSDLRFARSLDDGGSNIDNKALGAMFTYGLKGHAFGLGYQRMSGDTGFAYINGADAYLVNFVQIGDFANKDERSWQARYDFNFASVGIPGLTFMTRYLSGDNVDLGAARPNGKEWERDMDVGYVIQSGPLKNLGVKWRNATVRSTNFGNDLDENRLIVSYTVARW